MESVSNAKAPGMDGDGSSDSGILLAMTTQEDIRVVQTTVKHDQTKVKQHQRRLNKPQGFFCHCYRFQIFFRIQWCRCFFSLFLHLCIKLILDVDFLCQKTKSLTTYQSHEVSS